MMSEKMALRTLATSLILGITVGLSGCADSDGEFDFDGSGNPPAGQSNCRVDGTALCAIPTIGPQIVAGAGGSCPSNAGQLTPLGLCAVPGVGKPLAEGICAVSCPPAAPGSAPPLSLEQLCAIPTLGMQIVQGAGGTCPPPSGGGGGAPSPAQLCAIPAPIGPGLAGALGATCPGGGGGGGAPSLPASPVSGQCLPGDPTGQLCAP